MPNADCDYKEAGAAADWPKCANTTLVTADRLSGGARYPKESIPYRLAAGDPPVIQLEAPADEPEGPQFIYAGLRPTTFDAQRRVTAARIWLALCSKPPGAESGKLAATAAALPPDLEARAGGACVAKTAAAVRAAVKRSEGWIASGGDDDFSLSAHWVRDGER
jgi:hypothetical protein